jgi:hypothetical protein
MPDNEQDAPVIEQRELTEAELAKIESDAHAAPFVPGHPRFEEWAGDFLLQLYNETFSRDARFDRINPVNYQKPAKKG